jgi:hypothetical protein
MANAGLDEAGLCCKGPGLFGSRIGIAALAPRRLSGGIRGLRSLVELVLGIWIVGHL